MVTKKVKLYARNYKAVSKPIAIIFYYLGPEGCIEFQVSRNKLKLRIKKGTMKSLNKKA